MYLFLHIVEVQGVVLFYTLSARSEQRRESPWALVLDSLCPSSPLPLADSVALGRALNLLRLSPFP